MKTRQALKSDLGHLAVLMGIATAIGVYLVLTCVVIQRDGIFYIEQAQRLLDDPVAVARRSPIGYPALLLLSHKAMGLGDSAQAWAYSSQAVTLLTRVLALIPLYLAGKRLVGARRSFLAVLILIVLPNLAGYGSSVLREWPFVLFLGLGFWLLLVALQDRRVWMFGLVGVSAGLGYLIRPMCGQIVIYGLVTLAVAYRSQESDNRRGAIGAGVLMMAGLALPVLPCLAWTGRVIRPLLKPTPKTGVPTIVSVGSQSASREPLRFEVSVGQELQLAIEADDRDRDALTLSAVGTPLEARPVHRLHSVTSDACFWTISGTRKDALLEIYGSGVWDWGDIAYYAYAGADDAAGLRPVYRFWSPVVNRHFYTLDDPPHRSLPGDPNQWQPEGVAFYAFPTGSEPAGAVPIYRFRDEAGHYSWTTRAVVEAEGVAWYAQPAAPLPDGATLQDGSFQWRPAADQRGRYQFNIIVSDGKWLGCQLVQIDVVPASSESHRPHGPLQKPPVARAGILRLPAVVVQIIETLAHNLRRFFLLPLCLGFYHRFKHPTGRYERSLMIAIVAVNVGLMLIRGLWIDANVARRYCMALIVLTVFYIPMGLELMADGLRRCFPQTSRWPWLGVLTAVGIAICLPRLVQPIGVNGQGYRQVAQWLRSNTESHQIVAVPDRRIGFYAERQSRLYNRHPDPRRADYLVVIKTDETPGGKPDQWHQRYACKVGRKRNKTLVVYEIQ